MRFDIVKRTLLVDGLRISITLEAPFWRDLLEMATENELTLAEMISQIESSRDDKTDIASAIRVYVLSQLHAAMDARRDSASNAAA